MLDRRDMSLPAILQMEAIETLLAPILASPDAGAFIALVNRKLADLDPASATVWRFFLSSGMPPDKQ